MSTENSLIDAALRGWKSNVERADKLFEALSPEQLEQEVAAGKNRLIYLWGHLAAVNDALLPLLCIGERLHPEFDEIMFISNPDKSVRLTVSGRIAQNRVARNPTKSCGRVSRSSRRRIGQGGIPPFRRKSSSGNRTGANSPCS